MGEWVVGGEGCGEGRREARASWATGQQCGPRQSRTPIPRPTRADKAQSAPPCPWYDQDQAHAFLKRHGLAVRALGERRVVGGWVGGRARSQPLWMDAEHSVRPRGVLLTIALPCLPKP